MADLIVYGLELSPFMRKVQAVLHTKALDYDVEPVNIMDPPEWFSDISPLGRIPVLRHVPSGETGSQGTIADSSAICGFLEKLAPAPSIYPDLPYEYGRALWIEEYADTELAGTIGLGLFRPVVLPRFRGASSDLETAREAMREKVPRVLDSLEAMLDNQKLFVGSQVSIADIAVSSQLANMELVSGPPDPSRWPGLAAHLAAMKSTEVFQRNLIACEKLLEPLLPEPVDLGSG